MHNVSKYIENLMVKNRDFSYDYKIDDRIFKKYNVLLVDINIHFKKSIYKTQPILIGSYQDLKKLSIHLWNQCANEWNIKSIENNSCYSLKNNVLIPALSNIIESDLGKVLDIGSYNGELLYLIKKTKKLNIEEYIGIDLIEQDLINLYPISKKQKYIQQDISEYTKQEEKFDTILLSMTLLNIIKIDKTLPTILKLLKKNGKIYIADINSKAYQAIGFYYKKNNEWHLKQIFKNNQIFYTLKKLSKNCYSIHCFHHTNLYRNILEQYNMNVIDDFFVGPNKNEIIKHCININYQNKIIKKMAKYIKYPCFHIIKANNKS